MRHTKALNNRDATVETVKALEERDALPPPASPEADAAGPPPPHCGQSAASLVAQVNASL